MPENTLHIYDVEVTTRVRVRASNEQQALSVGVSASTQGAMKQTSSRGGLVYEADRPQVRCTEAEGLLVHMPAQASAAYEEAVRAALAELPLKNQKIVRSRVAGVN